MTSNTVPIYRHGRKFYVSAEEYARIRSEERKQRRTAVQKSQHLPVPKSDQASVRIRSASLHSSIQRSNSNPYEHTYDILQTPHIPVNRYDPNRLSRSTLRRSDDPNNVLSTILKKTPSTNIRSSSSNKMFDIRRTPLLLSDTDNDIKHSFSDELVQPLTSTRQQSPITSRQSIVPTGSDYGTSPTTTYSMTPTDQTHTQTNSSKLTNYLTRMKQSSLNPPSHPSSPVIFGMGSFFETGVQGSDHAYTALGSSNRRIGTGVSSLVGRSISDNTKIHYYQRNPTNDSMSDDNPSLSSTLIPREQIDINPYRQSESLGETDDDSGPQRNLWTRSTHRSQSSDGVTEKKRVRFADMEGLTLESKSEKNKTLSPLNNQLLSRRQHVKLPSDFRGRPRPFYNSLYQVTTKFDENKLATDV